MKLTVFIDAKDSIYMLIRMRTTLVLDDSVFEKAKRKAFEIGITLSEFTSLALRALMMKQVQSKKTASISLPTYGVKGEKILTDVEIKRLRDEDYFTL